MHVYIHIYIYIHISISYIHQNKNLKLILSDADNDDHKNNTMRYIRLDQIFSTRLVYLTLYYIFQCQRTCWIIKRHYPKFLQIHT